MTSDPGKAASRGLESRGLEGRTARVTGAARGGRRLQAGYAASKSGLIGLAQAVAVEHARDGIPCNAIPPGLIATENVARTPAEIRIDGGRSLDTGTPGIRRELKG